MLFQSAARILLFSIALSPFAFAGTLIPILAPEGYLTGEAMAINNAGQVAVSLYSGAFEGSASTTALFTPGVGLTNVGAGNGSSLGGTSFANGIGKDGTIVAGFFPGVQSSTAELLPASGGHINLANLGGSKGSQAMAINDSGITVGSSFNSSNRDHPVYWTADGTVKDMGTLGGSTTYGRAFAINASGLIVGTASAPNDDIIGKAFTYQIPASGSASMVAISGLGSGASDAYGVNNAGRVVGDHTVSGNLRAFSWYAGVVTELGVLAGGAESWANGINSQGQIVGYSDTADGGAAFLYQNGQMIDLNSLLPENSGWHLDNAWAINDLGQIVGNGTYNGLTQGFLLNTVDSVPEPMSLLLSGMGLAALAALKLRSRA